MSSPLRPVMRSTERGADTLVRLSASRPGTDWLAGTRKVGSGRRPKGNRDDGRHVVAAARDGRAGEIVTDNLALHADRQIHRAVAT